MWVKKRSANDSLDQKRFIVHNHESDVSIPTKAPESKLRID